MNWFIYALKNSFNFKDRARRREYGWFILIIVLISVTLGFIQSFSEKLNQNTISDTIKVMTYIFELLMLVPSISITTRRLHDLGYSGWWQVLIIILELPLYALDIIESFDNFDFSLYIKNISSSNAVIVAMSAIIFLLVYVGFNLWLLFKDGQPHANKYGESPKYPSDNSNPTSANNLGNLDA